MNLHDIVVGDSAACSFTLYNNGTCEFMSKLLFEIDGMGDDYRNDKLEIKSEFVSTY